ncbi:MAG: hypothetical protein HS108_14055 [Planctomycetes bacterium]|jgi:tetratricopeptide (TPR) repeat protein|nr:hypothetical protein [Planctomycetota bacterium]MCL4730969.1 hypothetical protein [Planctomycetota bacterium]
MRHTAVVAMLALVLAGSLAADRIQYLKRAGGKTTVETVDEVNITAWNAKAVTYQTADRKTGSIDTSTVLSLTRSTTMSRDLASALGSLSTDPESAVKALNEIASRGNDLDKEEALFRKADYFGTEARTTNRAPAYAQAVSEYSAYVNRYKAGFFAREAYTALSAAQQWQKKPADARATLRNMISADPVLQRLGNQKLGELEVRNGDWNAALTALKAAENASGDDKVAKYTAMAWQGLALLRKGDAAAARAILETVTNDETFQDDGNDDEAALAVAYPALGEAYFAAGNFQKAYDAYILAGYYVWWNQGDNEGKCLAQAYICAKKLSGTDEKWKKRAEKLKAALAIGFPKELADAEKEGG